MEFSWKHKIKEPTVVVVDSLHEKKTWRLAA